MSFRLESELPLFQWRWLWGLPWPFWHDHIEMISDFVTEHRLEPIDLEGMLYDDPVPIAPLRRPPGEERPIIRPQPFPGGIRGPHLHCKGKFYKLEPEQWAQFSRMRVDDLLQRLPEAKTISLQTLLELDNALGP